MADRRGDPPATPPLVPSSPPMAFLPICDFYYNRLNRNLHPRGRDLTVKRFLSVPSLLLPEAEITVSAVDSYYREIRIIFLHAIEEIKSNEFSMLSILNDKSIVIILQYVCSYRNWIIDFMS